MALSATSNYDHISGIRLLRAPGLSQHTLLPHRLQISQQPGQSPRLDDETGPADEGRLVSSLNSYYFVILVPVFVHTTNQLLSSHPDVLTMCHMFVSRLLKCLHKSFFLMLRAVLTACYLNFYLVVQFCEKVVSKWRS